MNIKHLIITAVVATLGMTSVSSMAAAPPVCPSLKSGFTISGVDNQGQVYLNGPGIWSGGIIATTKYKKKEAKKLALQTVSQTRKTSHNLAY